MKTNIPKLRFVEFKDYPAWEEKKFGEVVKVNQGLQISIDERKTNYEPELYFYITNEVLKSNGQVYYIEEPSKSVICSADDILMTRTGNTGMVVTGVKGVFHNNFFKIDYKQYFDKAYLVQSLEGDRIQNRIKRLAGQSTIPDLNHSDFYSIPISIPITDEQNIIGKFLSTLDKRIELQEKLIEKLEEEKKGYLQKLFPKKGKNIPGLRFEEFKGKGKWEEIKLYTVMSIPNHSKVDKPTTEKIVRVRLHLNGLARVADDSALNLSATNYYYRKAGQFIYGKQNIFNGCFDIVSCEYDNSYSSGDVTSLNFNNNFDSTFTYYYFSRKTFYNSLEKFAKGSGSKRLHEADLLNIAVTYPEYDEQVRIGMFLIEYTKLLKKERELLLKLKDFKEYMLRNTLI